MASHVDIKKYCHSSKLTRIRNLDILLDYSIHVGFLAGSCYKLFYESDSNLNKP